MAVNHFRIGGIVFLVRSFTVKLLKECITTCLNSHWNYWNHREKPDTPIGELGESVGNTFVKDEDADLSHTSLRCHSRHWSFSAITIFRRSRCGITIVDASSDASDWYLNAEKTYKIGDPFLSKNNVHGAFYLLNSDYIKNG
jgi:hypothetical protein